MATIHGRTILYASAVSSLSTKDVGRKHERILRCHDEDPQGIYTCSHIHALPETALVSTPAAIAAKAEQDVARVSQTYESTAVESVHLLARLRVRGSGWLAERGVDASWKWDSVSILGVASLGVRVREEEDVASEGGGGEGVALEV